MIGIHKIREEAHNFAMKFRAIENMIGRADFIRLWVDSSDEDQNKAYELIKKGDRDALKKWMKNHPSKSLYDKTVPQLRAIAKQLGIKYYTTLNQGQLVAEIIRKETASVGE